MKWILNIPTEIRSVKVKISIWKFIRNVYWPQIYNSKLGATSILGYIDPFVFGSGVSIIKDWSFLRMFPKFQLENRSGTAWIFSESTATSINFPIQISKSIISQTKANTVEQMKTMNCDLIFLILDKFEHKFA
jgi:hypothetical protein